MGDIKRYVTPVFRLSFPAVFEAESYLGGAAKFGLSAVWTPAGFSTLDKKRWTELKAALNAEARDRFKKPWKDLPANIKRGLRDGAEKADMEGYGDGTVFASVTTKMRPGVVDVDRNPISVEEGNADEIYPGCYCRATVTVYSYDNKGKGVAIGLMNLQKVADGERLDSRTDAADDFDDDVDARWLEQGDGDAAGDFDGIDGGGGGGGGGDLDDDIPF